MKDNPFVKTDNQQSGKLTIPSEPVAAPSAPIAPMNNPAADIPAHNAFATQQTRAIAPPTGRVCRAATTANNQTPQPGDSNYPWLDTKFYKQPSTTPQHTEQSPPVVDGTPASTQPSVPTRATQTPKLDHQPTTAPTTPAPQEQPTDRPQTTRPQRLKQFCQRHLHAIVAILSIAIIFVVLFLIDRNLRTVHLTLPANGLNITMSTNDKGEPAPTTIPVRILSYNADLNAPNQLLYYIDTTATVYPASSQNSQDQSDNSTNPASATLGLTWDIPDSARHRSTYTEVCLRDNDPLNKKVKDYCLSPNDNTAATHSVTDDATYPDTPNKVSCTYYVSAHSVGLVALVSGWNKLNPITYTEQLVGCAGSANDPNSPNYHSLGDSSFLAARYGFGSNNLSITNLDDHSGRDYSGLTMQNFFQSILDGENSTINAGDIINNSLSSNFNYNQNTHIIDLAPTGVIAGESCDITYTQTASRPAPENGSDNTTILTYTCIPVFNVDKYGRVTSVTTKLISYDAEHGNEVVGVTGSSSGLVRSGAGTFLDPYTLAIALNSDLGGLTIDSKGKLAIVAPQCTAKQTPQVIDPTGGNQDPSTNPDSNLSQQPDISLNKLQWTYDGENGKFTCVHDVDNQQLDIGDEDITTNNNYRRRYTVALSGDNASTVQFIDRDTDDQQLTKTNNSSATVGLNSVETYTVYLSGDNPSQIQFFDRDTKYTDGAGIAINTTNGANIISATVGKGVILLCPDGSTANCQETDKTIQINLGGDNNTGTIGGNNNGGLVFGNGQLRISAPSCGTGSEATKPNLTWDGNKFYCKSNADNATTDFNIAATGTLNAQGNPSPTNVTNGDTVTFGDNTPASTVGGTNGLTATRTGQTINYKINNTGVTAGAYAPQTAGNATSGFTISVPKFTVNAQGQLVSAGNQNILTIAPGNGFSYDTGTGAITMPGITACSGSPSTGLYWDSTSHTFKCTSPYRWNLTANGSASGLAINYDGTVNFNGSANGSYNNTTVTRSAGNITYNLGTTGVTANTYGTASGTTIEVPRFTVDAYGRLTFAGTRDITGGNGVSISSAGVISAKLLTGGGLSFDTSGNIRLPGVAACGVGTGLSWSGTTFSCTGPYSWNLTANGSGSTSITNSNTVNFSAGTGLSIAKSGNSITYTRNALTWADISSLISGGDGITVNNGTISLAGCTTAGQVRKWNGSSWQCSGDLDTILASERTITISFVDPIQQQPGDQTVSWTCTADQLGQSGEGTWMMTYTVPTSLIPAGATIVGVSANDMNRAMTANYAGRPLAIYLSNFSGRTVYVSAAIASVDNSYCSPLGATRQDWQVRLTITYKV